MTIHDYLMIAFQVDRQRAVERHRLLLEARRARRARRQRLVPAAPARRRTEKGKIVVSENVTLDGVIQDPAGDEGFRARGWVSPIGNSPQLAKLAPDEALAAGALLLGRRSYEWLAARWPSRSGELADRLNSLPKYVVSATLANPACHAGVSIHVPPTGRSAATRLRRLVISSSRRERRRRCGEPECGLCDRSGGSSDAGPRLRRVGQ